MAFVNVNQTVFFNFLKMKADKKAGRTLGRVNVYYFNTKMGLQTYLERIIIGMDTLQVNTNIVYDEEHDRVYFYNRFQSD